ncbi:hypothetical protein DBV05_g11037 [Lasiodiplodia theobromae]|uniref:Uncharacterized protein n=1 Tax=Lasiodiplodia theobromae TaxID=45133 RepID=A0A5N5CY39_9PEZI|nr:hypothetical protein DBV05_g11037 [Lasiodiplodia theobromae]
MITLSTAEQNTAAIHDFQRKNEIAMAEIIQQLGGLDITMQNLQALSDESSEVLERAVKDQEAALKEQLRLCEENRAAADSQTRNKQEYGNTMLGDNVRYAQFLDLNKAKGSFEQRYGDTVVGNGTWGAQGAMDGAIVDRMLNGPAAISQPESFRGPGRRIGGNVVSLNDVQSGPTPETKK